MSRNRSEESRTSPATTTTGTPCRRAARATPTGALPRRLCSFSKPEDLRGLVATETIYAGEQVTARRFRPKEERGIRAKLDGNLRAIEVMGTRAQLLGGTLREGDRTDVVANFEAETADGPHSLVHSP